MEPQAECMLVLIGATPEGKKELHSVSRCVACGRARKAGGSCWSTSRRAASLSHPRLATGDGALGFWKALEEVSPTTRHQRCTVHKTANVLDKLPKSVQPAGKADLREIWAAPDRATAQAAITQRSPRSTRTKYEKAVSCLIKDRDALLTFYDFPAEHWDHLRTSRSNRERVRHGTLPASHGADQGRRCRRTRLG